jgi:hypothetical protein
VTPGGELYAARLRAELRRDLEGIDYLWLHGRLKREQVLEMRARAQLVHDSLLQLAGAPFRVWREDIGGRVRYIARAVSLGINPYTLVTADVGELRHALLASNPPAHFASDPPAGGPR